MRHLAWVLVGAGLLVAIAAPVALTMQASGWGAQALERAPFVEISALDRAGYRRAVTAEAELLGWRPAAVTAGLAVTGFGVLILAIRKPEKRTAKDP